MHNHNSQENQSSLYQQPEAAYSFSFHGDLVSENFTVATVNTLPWYPRVYAKVVSTFAFYALIILGYTSFVVASSKFELTNWRHKPIHRDIFIYIFPWINICIVVYFLVAFFDLYFRNVRTKTFHRFKNTLFHLTNALTWFLCFFYLAFFLPSRITTAADAISVFIHDFFAYIFPAFLLFLENITISHEQRFTTTRTLLSLFFIALIIGGYILRTELIFGWAVESPYRYLQRFIVRNRIFVYISWLLVSVGSYFSSRWIGSRFWPEFTLSEQSPLLN